MAGNKILMIGEKESFIVRVLVKKVKDGVRLFGNGKLTGKVTIRVVGATETAKQAVEKAGGELIIEPIKKAVLVKGQKTSKKEAKKLVKKAKKTK